MSDEVEFALRTALQEAWNDYVGDTRCLPSGISIHRHRLDIDWMVTNLLRGIVGHLDAAGFGAAWNRRTPETPRADGGLRERVAEIVRALEAGHWDVVYQGSVAAELRTALAAPDAGDGWHDIAGLVMDVRAIWLVCSGKVYEGWAHPPDARLRIATHYHERQERPAPPTVTGGVDG